VELGGHTEENRLPVLAWHPAPIQLSGIGYMGSTGLRAVDGFLSDCWCIPQGDVNPFFTEPILRLPHSHFCYTPLQPLPYRQESPAARNGFVTFCCFNNFSKVTDELLLLWREILTRLPSSRLVLKSGHFDHEAERRFIEERMRGLGLPMARIECRGLSPHYLEEYGEIDIALDTYPYVGGLTTCEALLCGVPVVSLYGQRHGTRFGLSFLANIGLEELAVGTPEEYMERAVGLAQDTELLGLLRQQLPACMAASPLMNRAGYMHDLEKVFERLYREEEPHAGRKYSSMSAAAGAGVDVETDGH
jgi:predicted O-linked N-acetylglucosamine transferase (SPINDLY family)